MKTLTHLACLLLVSLPALAQTDDDPLSGLWQGEIQTPGGGLATSFLIEPADTGDRTGDRTGAWTGSADTPAQGVFALPLTAVELADDDRVVFRMAHAHYEGQLDREARQLVGHWVQGGARVRFDCSWSSPPPAVPETLAHALPGTFEGVLVAGAVELRVVFVLQATPDGGLGGHMLSPDQTTTEYPVARVDFLGERRVRLAVPSLGASFECELSAADEAHPGGLSGTYRQGAATFPLELRRVERATPVRRPQLPQPPFPYRALEVSYPNEAGGVTLAGTLTLPEGEGPFACALLITGSGAQDRDETIFEHRPFLVIADHLTRNGIAVLRVDDRGVGGSSAGPDPGAATTADFAGDVEAGLAYLKSRPEIAADRIGLIGHSEGGVIAPMVARDSARVAWIVLLAGPGVPGDALLQMQIEALARAEGQSGEELEEVLETQRRLLALALDDDLSPARASERMRAVLEASPDLPQGEARAGAIAAALAQLDSAWVRWFLRHDPGPVLGQVRCPVLALNGTLDLQVPWRANLEGIGAALERAGNEDVTLRALEGLNHLFQHAETGRVAEYGRIEETFAVQVLELMTDWIAERTGD